MPQNLQMIQVSAHHTNKSDLNRRVRKRETDVASTSGVISSSKCILNTSRVPTATEVPNAQVTFVYQLFQLLPDKSHAACVQVATTVWCAVTLGIPVQNKSDDNLK